MALSDKLDQIDLIDIFRAFHPKVVAHALFPRAQGTFSRIDLMLGHKTSLSKFKMMKIISSIFSYHHGMKLEINYKIKTEKHTDTWRLNNLLLNNAYIKNDIKEESKIYFETNKNENTT